MNAFILFFFLLNSVCYPYVIDYSLTKVLSINDTNAYFGFSILLQRGNPPLAIVGAPRKRVRNDNKGAVYQCNLNTLSCVEYTRISRDRDREVDIQDKNGEFLGSALDGHDRTGYTYFTCAPRFFDKVSDQYFIKGRCFAVSDSANANTAGQLILPLESAANIGLYSRIPYYDAAFAESGLDIVFLQDLRELLIGAPGKAHWTGALLRNRLQSNESTTFARQRNWSLYQDSYYGYAVSWGKFIRGSNEIWYVSGAPRSNKLKGSVAFFERIKKEIKGELFGEEFGSYFGAAFLVIHKKFGGDDILVGAPMCSGKSWDEGCVYYYRNKNNGAFHNPVKFAGKTRKSRFGAAIADLGDMDLDTFTDCAISAPYEDDGIGAVYLYYGTSQGFSDNNYHKISPSNFALTYPRMVIRGFGMGISRGNDIDNNGHTDIAIGAYQSGQVFYFRSKDIIDFNQSMTSSIHTLYPTTINFTVKHCLLYTQRNKKSSTKFFTRQILLLDDRVISTRNITEIVKIFSDRENCKEYTIRLKADHLKTEPLYITYQYKTSDSNFTKETLTIPVSYGCRRNNICETDLSVKATSGNMSSVVIGLTNELHLNVTFDNSGEFAFQTKLYLTVPPEINLIHLRECYFESGNYVCVKPGLFKGRSEKSFLLDLANLAPDRTSLPIKLRIDSDGEELTPADNEFTVELPVLLLNNPYIDSISRPDSIIINNGQHFLEIGHYFMVGNQGPSPVKLNLILMVPKLEVNGTQLLEVTPMEGVNADSINECSFLNTSLIDVKTLNLSLPYSNNSIMLSCFEAPLECVQILCEGGYFFKSNENAMFSLGLKISTDSLVKFSGDKDSVTIISAAYLKNGTTEIIATASTTVYGLSSNSKIPLWIYVCSAVAGILLLLAMVLILYKCNFFRRTYREKLINEETTEEEEPATEETVELKEPPTEEVKEE